MLGIALEGCACRAAFHAGVIAALLEGGLSFPLAAGTSSGSICAAALAAGRGKDLPALWLALGGRSIVSWRRILWNRSPFDMSHLVRNALLEALGPSQNPQGKQPPDTIDLRAGPGEALAVATRLRDLSRVVFSSREEEDLLAPLLGSCFFPVFYGRPVRVRGELLLDGGITDNLPLEALAERGATEIIASVTSPDGLAFKSLRQTRWRPTLPGVKVHVIHPRQPLAARSWDLNLDRMRRTIDEGYAQGRAFLGT